MAWTPPKTWLTDEFVDTAEMNTHLRDNLLAISSIPRARVYHSTSQTIGPLAETVLTFDSERYDTDAIHDPAVNPSRLTCKTVGCYATFAHINSDISSGDTQYAYIRLNGTTAIAMQPQYFATGARAFTVGTIYPLAVNDYLEVVYFHTDATNRLVLKSDNYSPEFLMHRLSE